MYQKEEILNSLIVRGIENNTILKYIYEKNKEIWILLYECNAAIDKYVYDILIFKCEECMYGMYTTITLNLHIKTLHVGDTSDIT